MKEYTDEHLTKVRQIIEANDTARAKEYLDLLHPADIAELLADLDLEQAEFLKALLDE